MNLQQIRYFQCIVKNQLNLTRAAKQLRVSQPAISKQVILLERELGVQLFTREGKRIIALSDVGKKILQKCELINYTVENIKVVVSESLQPDRGSLSIATTHTLARYGLPKVIERFQAKYPKVQLHIRQGEPEQLLNFIQEGEVDFVLATESIEMFKDFNIIPCYHWHYQILVHTSHPIAKVQKISYDDLAKVALITYVFALKEGTKLNQTLKKHLKLPKIALTATDAEVIKTYVAMNLGVGIIADIACSDLDECNFKKFDASHLFEEESIYLCLNPFSVVREYMKDFILLFAPQLDDKAIINHHKLKQNNPRKINSFVLSNL